MSLITTIRADQLAARKQGPSARVGANLLTTLIGEADRVGKDAGGRAPTDDEVTAVIRKFVKNIDETLRVRPDDAQAVAEKTILVGYLPQALSTDEVRSFIAGQTQVANPTVRDTKAIFELINAVYPGRATSAQVSTILRENA